jgi:hypothetical protein
MASKKDPQNNPTPPTTKPPATTPAKPPKKDGPVRTQMVGEHGDEDIGYDPTSIPVEDIPED